MAPYWHSYSLPGSRIAIGGTTGTFVLISAVHCEHAPELLNKNACHTKTNMQMHTFYTFLHSQRDLYCH